MDKKRFKKQELKCDDYKGMEQGAKVLKRALAAAGSVGVMILNKDKLKSLGKFATKIILKK